MSEGLDFTGERFVPGTPGEIWYEHWHRYLFAAPLAAGRRVLDVACGEGYGSALLAGTAQHVTGVDIAPAVIEHARARYAATDNLEFHRADGSRLPFADASFDVVTSFETLEHISAQEAFLDEIRRVLRPGGLLVLSCPNRVEYTEKRGVTNEFHVREFDRTEFAALLAPRFPHVAWYGQRAGFFSVVWAERGESRGEIFEVTESTADRPTPGHVRPLYFIVVASTSRHAVDSVAPRLSVLADRDEWVYRNYESVTRAYMALDRERAARQAAQAAAEARLAEALTERDALRAALAASEAERAPCRRKGAPAPRWSLAGPLGRLRAALARRRTND
jgi:SAM-dependent methyltransferase